MDTKELTDIFYQKCVRRIAARPRSEKEIGSFLTKKLTRYQLSALDQTQIEESLLKHLKEENLVNDLDFISWWVEQRTYFKPKGKRGLVYELLQKGIQKDLIETFFEENPVEEKHTAQHVLAKRKQMYEVYQGPQRYKKAMSFLLRRGFSYDAAKKAFEETFAME